MRFLAITREQKEQFVAEYTENFKKAQAVYLADYRGLSVEQMSELRGNLRENGGSSVLTVAKNTLLKLALEQADRPALDELLEGPTAVLFAYDDPVAPVKVLRNYADENEELVLKGGLLGVDVLDSDDLARLADLPSREEILATLVGAIQAPARQLVSLLQAPQRDLILTLQARAEQGEE